MSQHRDSSGLYGHIRADGSSNDQETLRKLYEQRSCEESLHELHIEGCSSAGQLQGNNTLRYPVQSNPEVDQQGLDACHVRSSLADMEVVAMLQETRSDLKQVEKELKSATDRLNERYFNILHRGAGSELKREVKELKSATDRLNEICFNILQRGAGINEMEEFYIQKLRKTESALKQKEEELRSFKDRVAEDVSLSIKTGSTISMNNPVNIARLKEMYESLRVQQWPKMKNNLKSKHDPQRVKASIQKMFDKAAAQMERKKKQIDEVFEQSSGLKPHMFQEYRMSTIQNLQLGLYHSRNGVFKAAFLEYGQEPQDVWNLASECYWFGCLMTLNNPPLQPDWEKHVPGMDPWDIFPRDIRAVSVK